MLAPDLPLELIPLAGNHMEDFLQTWRVTDMRESVTDDTEKDKHREDNNERQRQIYDSSGGKNDTHNSIQLSN